MVYNIVKTTRLWKMKKIHKKAQNAGKPIENDSSLYLFDFSKKANEHM